MAINIDFYYVYYSAEPTRENWNKLERGQDRVKAFEMDDSTTVHHLEKEIARLHSANPWETEMWKLRKPESLTSRGVSALLVANDYDITQIADEVNDIQSLADVLGANWPEALEQTTFILFLPPALAPEVKDDNKIADQKGDIVTELHKGFHRFVNASASWPTPSAAAESTAYNEIQGSKTAILDGRFCVDGPATTAPPIELYHPVFAQFKKACDSSDPIPEEHLRQTSKLLRNLSAIATRDEFETLTIIECLLGASLRTIPNHDEISVDFCHLAATPFDVSAANLFLEVNEELGTGISDPSVRASFLFTRFWIHDARKPIRDACCCPSFLVGLAGPWIVILGAVLTSRPIVQRLTPYLWFGCSRALDDQQVLGLARPLYALKLALANLKEYYSSLRAIPWIKHRVHPRFCPSITQYPLGDKLVLFKYVRPLQSDATCVTYQIEIDGKPAVVKFVQQYSEAAHALMAEKGFAPGLKYYGLLGDGYGNLGMAVMDWVEGKTLHEVYGTEPLPENVRSKVREALEMLNQNGFVFGDLRRPNIMLCDSDQSIKFIDFDWAGKNEEVRYPFHLSSFIRDAVGAEEYGFITVEHQDALFRSL